MDEATLSRILTQSLSLGIAVVEPETWRICFENDRFVRLFPSTAKNTDYMTKRIPDFDTRRAVDDLSAGGSHNFKTKTWVDGLEIRIGIEIRLLPEPEVPFAVVECLDISEQHEIQYALQSFSNIAESNLRNINREKERAAKLLLNVMPRFACEELKEYGSVTPQKFDNVTVMLIDFVNFTQMAIAKSPGHIVTELNDIFTVIDRMSEIYGCDRIKTIGYAYLVVCGLIKPEPQHAHNIAQLALRVRQFLQRRNLTYEEPWKCRIGISSQPVVGAVVGVQKFAYDIFGPGVNLAARMESASNAMEITVSQDTYSLLREDFVFEALGEKKIKGFGTQRLYRLEAEKRV